MNSDETGKDTARPAKTGKKGRAEKAARGEKGEKGEVLGEVRRLAEDLAALRSAVARLQTTEAGGSSAKISRRASSVLEATGVSTVASGRTTEEEIARQLHGVVSAAGMPAVAIGFALPAAKTGDAAVMTGSQLLDEPREEREARAARLGFALSSPQKLALARLLLLNGPQSAAQLGAEAGLTTGSLYHHLRDMQHAGVLAPAGRSRFALTALGSHATLTLLALAAHYPPG